MKCGIVALPVFDCVVVKASTEVVKKNYAAGVQTSCWLNPFN
jgi:hypothetical protein